VGDSRPSPSEKSSTWRMTENSFFISCRMPFAFTMGVSVKEAKYRSSIDSQNSIPAR